MKQIWKRVLALCMVLAMALAMSMTAFAAEPGNTDDGPSTLSLNGYTFINGPKNFSDATVAYNKDHYEVAGSTEVFNLIKRYTLTEGFDVDAGTSVSPAFNFSVTIAPYKYYIGGVEQTGKLPALPKTVTINTSPNLAKNKSETDKATASQNKWLYSTSGEDELAEYGIAWSDEITLPTYTDAGDYWYTVKENNPKVAGVAYDSKTYYLHVQVIRDGIGADADLYPLVTLHTAEPNSKGNGTGVLPDAEDKNQRIVNIADGDEKNKPIENTYASGQLTIQKELAGNFTNAELADSQVFAVDVTFTAPKGMTVYSDIKYSGGFTDEVNGVPLTDGIIQGSTTTGWTGSKSVTVYIKAGEDKSVTFTNIPEGVTYTVKEHEYTSDYYDIPMYEFDSDPDDEATDTTVNGKTTWDANLAKGTITDVKDVLTITNTKKVSIDVGVALETAPYVMIMGAGVGMLVLLARRKRENEE